MGERKVLNKYIPPDFDPSKLRRIRMKKKSKEVIRTMLAFGIQCTTCGEFMGAGKKFNAKKEEAGSYLTIKRYRFYIKCSVCSTQITYRTDPKNGDYEIEQGATRIFELRKEQDRERDEAQAEAQQLEEGGDAMAAVEAKAKASRREMDSLAALEKLQAEGQRRRGLGPDHIMQHLKEQHAVGAAAAQEGASAGAMAEAANVRAAKSALEEDEAAARAAFAARRIRRLDDGVSSSDSASLSAAPSSSTVSVPSGSGSSSAVDGKRKQGTVAVGALGAPRLKKRRRANPAKGMGIASSKSLLSAPAPERPAAPPLASAASMLGQYQSSSDSDDD